MKRATLASEPGINFLALRLTESLNELLSGVVELGVCGGDSEDRKCDEDLGELHFAIITQVREVRMS
jgi:hypothetical protein